ncbi:hypothetical protein GCM10029964_083330 [Kibdelosporangium lantanae]
MADFARVQADPFTGRVVVVQGHVEGVVDHDEGVHGVNSSASAQWRRCRTVSASDVPRRHVSSNAVIPLTLEELHQGAQGGR